MRTCYPTAVLRDFRDQLAELVEGEPYRTWQRLWALCYMSAWWSVIRGVRAPMIYVLNLDAARSLTAVVVPTLSHIVKPPMRTLSGGDLQQTRQQSALEL